MNARILSHTSKTSWGARCLMGIFAAIAILSPVQVSALSLPIGAEVNLPLGGTVADTLLTPVTNQTNNLLPVTVNPDDDSLGVEITPPPASGNESANDTTPPPALDISIGAPIVPALINSVTSPLIAASKPLASPTESQRRVLTSPLPSPQVTEITEENTFDPLPSVHTAAAQTDNTDITVKGTYRSSLGANNSDSLTIPPMILGAANFIGRGLPADVQHIANSFTGNTAMLVPVIVSIGIFILMIAMIIGIVYAMDHAKILATSTGRIGQFAETHDVTQIAAAAVVVIGAIIAIGFLTVTYLT